MPTTFEQLLLSHPANQGLLNYLLPRASHGRTNPVCRPEDTEQPYLSLGAHPDMVERLWKQLSKEFFERCDWVVYATPVLAHPRSGIIFAVALGTTYAMRLPPETNQQARVAGAKSIHAFHKTSLDLAPFGDGWVFGMWHKAEVGWCLAAYREADKSSSA